MKEVCLSTPHLRLEPLLTRHADSMYEVLRDPRIYAFLDESPPKSVEALTKRYALLQKRLSPDGKHHWLNWILWSKEDHVYIGYVQATVSPSSGTANIAFVLASSYWGKNLAFESVTAMLASLIEIYGPLKVEATADRRNERSLALLERLGLKPQTDPATSVSEVHFSLG